MSLPSPHQSRKSKILRYVPGKYWGESTIITRLCRRSNARMRIIFLFAAIFLLAPTYAMALPAGEDEARRFRAYLDADWKRWMEEYPEVATGVGYPGQDARWTDDSPIGIQRKDKHLAESIAQLKEIRRDALPES